MPPTPSSWNQLSSGNRTTSLDSSAAASFEGSSCFNSLRVQEIFPSIGSLVELSRFSLISTTTDTFEI